MNFSKHPNLIGAYPDVEIILLNPREIIKLNLNRIILALASEYFRNLFTIDAKQTSFIVPVENTQFMKQAIMQCYQIKPELDVPHWKLFLEIFECNNFLGIDNDFNELCQLTVPEEGFELLCSVIKNLDIVNNHVLISTIGRNMPKAYDFTRLPEILYREFNRYEFIVIGNPKIIILDRFKHVSTVDYYYNRNVLSVDISPDNSKIACDNTNSISIFDTISRKLLFEINHNNVYCVKFSHNGQKIVSIGKDNGSPKIYENACIFICFWRGFLCSAKKFCEAKRAKNICIC